MSARRGPWWLVAVARLVALTLGALAALGFCYMLILAAVILGGG